MYAGGEIGYVALRMVASGVSNVVACVVLRFKTW